MKMVTVSIYCKNCLKFSTNNKTWTGSCQTHMNPHKNMIYILQKFYLLKCPTRSDLAYQYECLTGKGDGMCRKIVKEGFFFCFYLC